MVSPTCFSMPAHIVAGISAQSKSAAELKVVTSVFRLTNRPCAPARKRSPADEKFTPRRRAQFNGEF